MVALNRKELRAYERTRAAGLVQDYEQVLRDALAAKPFAKNAGDVRKIVTKLMEIRMQIMGSFKSYSSIKRGPNGDFSLEEIEDALNFVEDKNPFEEEK